MGNPDLEVPLCLPGGGGSLDLGGGEARNGSKTKP